MAITQVEHHVGNPVVTHQLLELPLDQADAIMILADDEAEEAIESDSAVLTALLHISRRNGLRCKPLCEVCDWRTERIVRKSDVLQERGTFVRSSELETGVFALCAHNPIMGSVMRDLVSGAATVGRARVAVIDAMLFVNDGSQCCFRDMAAKTKRLGDTLIGYSKRGQEAGIQDVVLNPLNKNETIQWGMGDALVVITPGTFQCETE